MRASLLSMGVAPDEMIWCSGVMGVPITFMDKYNPEQFEIIGATESEGKGFANGLWNGTVAQAMVKNERVYKRLFIRPKKGAKD